MSANAHLIEQANRRSLGYWILSGMFLEVPTAARVEELRRMLDGESAESGDVAELCRQLDAARFNLNDAAVAFTRHLVIGDKKHNEPLPYEAHIREGQLPGECTGQVREMMFEAGYGEIAADASSPDHLGAELRFMALLCRDENLAWAAESSAAVGRNLRLQHRFLSDHLARWAPAYCEALAERTTNGYLRAIARVTASSINDDLAILEDICSWLPPEELTPPISTETVLPAGAAQGYQ